MDEKDLVILDLREKGKSVRQISSQIGLSKSAVHRRLQKMGHMNIDSSTAERRALEAEIRKRDARLHLFDIIGERFIEAAKAMDPVEPYKPAQRSAPNANEDWVHLISDVQAGSKVEFDETGGLGNFNTDILVEEIQFYKESFQSIYNYHVNKPTNGKVFLLGDMIDGSTIFWGQQRALDMNTVDQVMFVVEHFTELINWLSQFYEKLDVYGIYGNHGRIGKKGENSPRDNLDYLAYQWIKERLANNERVSVNASESWFQLVDVRSHRFLNIHGDDTPASYLGISFYGAQKIERRWQTLLKDLSGYTGGFDYLTMGHHHTPAEFYNIFMNGAWPGGSEYSLKRLTIGGMPSQKLFAVHDRYGVTWKRDILLRRPEGLDVRVYG